MTSKIVLYQVESETVATPVEGSRSFFLDSDGRYKTKDPSGAVTPVEQVLSNDIPNPLGEGDAGTSTAGSRADHAHEHGQQGGGDQHAVATESEAGFMSAADRFTINALTAATTSPVDPGRFYAGPANVTQDTLTAPMGSGLTLDATLTKATQPLAGGWDTAYSGAVNTTGSRVFEFKLTDGVAPNSFFIGLADAFTDGNLDPAAPGTTNIYGYTSGGTLPERVAIYVNFDTGAGWIAVDGIYQSGNPETGTSPSFTFTANTPLAAVVSLFDVLTAEFRTASEFIESFIPTNFIAWSGDTQASPPAFRRIVARDISLSVRTVTASQTVLGTDATVLADASSGGITLSLRTAEKYANRMFHFKKIDNSANAVTITAPEMIDGQANALLQAPMESLTVQSDGSEWWIIQRTISS
jgi:hypothetical protein